MDGTDRLASVWLHPGKVHSWQANNKRQKLLGKSVTEFVTNPARGYRISAYSHGYLELLKYLEEYYR